MYPENFLNFFTDYGFKKIFGEEPNKDLLIDFLNELLKEEEGKIISLNYLNSEQLGIKNKDRKAIFDIYCENEKGEKIIVEIQKTKQQFFKERTLILFNFPIQKCAKGKRNWNYKLDKI